jgi:hypothetical protein
MKTRRLKMPILRLGNVIRLNGIDAESFLADTGRKNLPTNINEYNLAMQELKELWSLFDSADSKLIAATCFDELGPI